MTGKRRRSHGEWSVYEQRPGVWAAVVDLGWIDGKRCGRYVYAKTEADAIAKRDGLRRQLQLGVNLAAQSRTVATWLTEWLTDIKAHDDTRASTLRRYSEVVNTHLIPGIGLTRLDRLTPRDVQRLIGSLRDRVAPATVVKIHGVLRVALSDAERLDLVPRNVAKAAKPPGLGRNERRALTPDEAKRLAAMIEKRHEPLFMVALSTGLRRGELLALRWSDVDLESGTLFVRRALQTTEGAASVCPAEDLLLGSCGTSICAHAEGAGASAGRAGEGAAGRWGTLAGARSGVR